MSSRRDLRRIWNRRRLAEGGRVWCSEADHRGACAAGSLPGGLLWSRGASQKSRRHASHQARHVGELAKKGFKVYCYDIAPKARAALRRAGGIAIDSQTSFRRPRSSHFAPQRAALHFLSAAKQGCGRDRDSTLPSRTSKARTREKKTASPSRLPLSAPLAAGGDWWCCKGDGSLCKGVPTIRFSGLSSTSSGAARQPEKFVANLMVRSKRLRRRGSRSASRPAQAAGISTCGRRAGTRACSRVRGVP